MARGIRRKLQVMRFGNITGDRSRFGGIELHGWEGRIRYFEQKTACPKPSRATFVTGFRDTRETSPE